MSTDTQNSAPVSVGPVTLPKCPFQCGWDGLHKIAVQDAAYLAKVQWPEDEEGVSVPRATAMRSMDYLIQVCRTMLNAAPIAAQPDQNPTQQTLDDVKAGIPARDAEIEALRKELETLQAEVLNMVQMLEANEWADHCGKSELGQRLEWAITALQNRIAELTKSSSQQDADKVDAWQCTTTLTESDDLIWLYCQDTNTIDGPVASSPEFIDSWTHWAWVKHPSTASIDAARKEPGQ